MNEYHMPFESALWFPLPAGFALMLPLRERRGVEDGGSFVDQEIARSMNRMKHFLQSNYDIV